jgi:hypothetical protein
LLLQLPILPVVLAVALPQPLLDVDRALVLSRTSVDRLASANNLDSEPSQDLVPRDLEGRVASDSSSSKVPPREQSESYLPKYNHQQSLSHSQFFSTPQLA